MTQPSDLPDDLPEPLASELFRLVDGASTAFWPGVEALADRAPEHADALAFSPDGGLLVAATPTAHAIHDAKTGERLGYAAGTPLSVRDDRVLVRQGDGLAVIDPRRGIVTRTWADLQVADAVLSGDGHAVLFRPQLPTDIGKPIQPPLDVAMATGWGWRRLEIDEPGGFRDLPWRRAELALEPISRLGDEVSVGSKQLVVKLDDDLVISVWSSGRRIGRLRTGKVGLPVAAAGAADRLVVASYDASLRILDTERLAVDLFQANVEPDARLSANGRWTACLGRLVDLAGRRTLPLPLAANAVCFAGEDHAVAMNGSTVELIGLEDGSREARQLPDRPVTTMTHWRGRIMVVGLAGPSIRTWDPATDTWHSLWTPPEPSNPVARIEPAGAWLVIERDRGPEILDPDAGTPTPIGPRGCRLLRAAKHPNHVWLATSDRLILLRLPDRCIQQEQILPSCSAVAESTERIAVSHADGRISILDRHLEHLATLRAAGGQPLGWTEDGDLLVALADTVGRFRTRHTPLAIAADDLRWGSNGDFDALAPVERFAVSEQFVERVDPPASDWLANHHSDDVLVAIGSAAVAGSATAARIRAGANARTQIASVMEATIRSLVRAWLTDACGMTDETAMGEHDEDIAGEVRDNVQYALVALQDPSAWVHDVGASLQRNALQDDRLFATEDMKRSFAAKLDELIDRDATRIRDATGAFLANHAGVNTFVK